MTELIGDGFKKDATELEKLSAYADDTAVLEKLLAVKQGKKRRTCVLSETDTKHCH